MCPKRILISLIFALILPVTMLIPPALSVSHDEIFKWVFDELSITNNYSMPEILLVSKKELQIVFKDNTGQSYKRWSQMYGSEEAERILDFFLKEVIGLFNPDTKKIYVGSFLDGCKQEAIVAHELTHYFQFMQHGKIDPNMGGADIIQMKNEFQAEKIESKYIQTFCQPSDSTVNPKSAHRRSAPR